MRSAHLSRSSTAREWLSTC